MNDIVEYFVEANGAMISPEGIRLPQGIVELHDGSLHVYAFDCRGPQDVPMVYYQMLKAFLEHRPKNMIWGIDRNAKPERGIHTDFLSVTWFQGEDYPGGTPSDQLFRTGIMPYSYEPRRVGPILWNHPFFTRHYRLELMAFWGPLLWPQLRHPFPIMTQPKPEGGGPE